MGDFEAVMRELRWERCVLALLALRRELVVRLALGVW